MIEPPKLPTVDINHRLVMPEPNSGCWLWLGTLSKGYGRVVRNGKGRRPNASAQAHRLSYIHARGPIGDGLALDHLCRNRCCVNPDHLEPVTIGDNVRRGAGVHGRFRTHCPKGHPLSSDNVVAYGPHKYCRTCKSINHRAWWQKRKARGEKK